MSERITDAIVKRVSAGDRPQVFFWDADVKGFGLRVTNRGAKSFILDYRIGGRQRRITIGSYPDWSVAAARTEAGNLKREVDLGNDPMGERHADRAAPTMRDLWDRYKRDHLPRKATRSQADETMMWEKLVLPTLGKHKVTDVTHTDIEALHRDITTQRGTPVRANRVIEVVRRAFNLAIRWEWVEKNPASGQLRNPEEKRQRYLSPEELSRLSAALAAHHEPVSADAIRMLMLTGARKSEVLGATWEMFDLDAGVWTKPSAHTKQRKEHRVPVSANALTLLKRIRETAEGPYVFPGKGGDQPLTDVKRSGRRCARRPTSPAPASMTCAIPSPRCWSAAARRCRSSAPCWATPRCRPPSATPTSTTSRCGPPPTMSAKPSTWRARNSKLAADGTNRETAWPAVSLPFSGEPYRTSSTT